MTLTITTCLYDIRKKEGNKSENVKKDYLELGKHMLSIRLPMVIFTDEEYIVGSVYKTRKEYGLIDKTLIVRLPFEETLFYKDCGLLKQRMDQFPLTNINKDKDTPLYVLLNNNKFDFITRTIQQNPFQTDYFLWMDFGIWHCSQATPQDWENVAQEWFLFMQQQENQQQIHQLRIHLPSKPKSVPWKNYLNTIYHHVAGGVFGGHRDIIQEYAQLFYSKWRTMLDQEQWWQLDEAVMTMIADEYPEKFRFFYGDYDGIISNFIHVKKMSYLVFQITRRYLDQHQPQMAARVLKTIDRRYIKNQNDMDEYNALLKRMSD